MTEGLVTIEAHDGAYFIADRTPNETGCVRYTPVDEGAYFALPKMGGAQRDAELSA